MGHHRLSLISPGMRALARGMSDSARARS